jgi:hypothetical protein
MSFFKAEQKYVLVYDIKKYSLKILKIQDLKLRSSYLALHLFIFIYPFYKFFLIFWIKKLFSQT